jgi:aminomethyltransferase
MTELLRTPLYDWHVAHGGRMVEFGGWEMPVQYTGIVEEHHAVRKAAGLFDISHMGRFGISGPDAATALDRLVTCSVATMAPMQIRYGLMCRSDGGILDDVLVYRWGDTQYSLVVNASNRSKIYDWMQAQTNGLNCKLIDATTSSSMMALQGPRAVDVIRALEYGTGESRSNFTDLKYYHQTFRVMNYRGKGCPVNISRTGYTGEDGFEFIWSTADAVGLWEYLIELGSPFGVKPCGLGCRDTLRLEAAMPLYGHELTEAIDPLTAGLAFAVKLDKPDFIGKAALVEIAKRTDRPVRVGLQLAGRRIAREGAAVFSGDNRIGEVTSGTFSPTLEQAIAMAYVAPNSSSIGTAVEVDIRGKREAATVVKLPFYQRAK